MDTNNRRQGLKIGVLLSVGSTPVVSAVLLQAHAQTSATGLADVTLPPPGLRACQMSDASTIEAFGATVQKHWKFVFGDYGDRCVCRYRCVCLDTGHIVAGYSSGKWDARSSLYSIIGVCLYEQSESGLDCCLPN